MNPAAPEEKPLSTVEWLIVIVATIGFAFDIYELLMLPIIARPALVELLQVPPDSPLILEWIGYLFWLPAICGGVFGMIGGLLTDWFGRRRVLVWSILLYAFSAFAAGFSTTPGMLLFFRCTTFVGVCLEFVAATAWLAELFPEHKRREKILGWTQAASSVGGFLVTGANMLSVRFADALPAIYGGHSSWRYTLISGLIPAIPLIILRPFLPESPMWEAKVKSGEKISRPGVLEIFRPDLRRATIIATVLLATSYGAAFGGLQMVPQIVPGLVPEAVALREQARGIAARERTLQEQLRTTQDAATQTTLQDEVKTLQDEQRALLRKAGPMEQQKWNRTQLIQEVGGLCGRIAFAALTLYVVSRRVMLRSFQFPALILIPLVFAVAGTNSYTVLNWGIFFCGFLVVAQFSFYGNYLPQVFPTRLRGTGEGFAVNVGGRMIGTSAAFVTTQLAQAGFWGQGLSRPSKIAYSAALVVAVVYLIGVVCSRFMPEPAPKALEE